MEGNRLLWPNAEAFAVNIADGAACAVGFDSADCVEETFTPNALVLLLRRICGFGPQPNIFFLEAWGVWEQV